MLGRYRDRRSCRIFHIRFLINDFPRVIVADSVEDQCATGVEYLTNRLDHSPHPYPAKFSMDRA